MFLQCISLPAKHPNPSSRAPPPPQIEHETDVSESSLIDVDSVHVGTVPSDYDSQSVKTNTQAERLEREAEEAEEKAKAEYHHAKKKTSQKSSGAAKKLQDNKENPVIIANVIGIVAGGLYLGFAGYNKHKIGELTWELVGTTAAVVGVVGAGSYFGSQWLLNNKYPTK